MKIRYVGLSHIREIRKEDITRHGIEYDGPDLVWGAANRFTINDAIDHDGKTGFFSEDVARLIKMEGDFQIEVEATQGDAAQEEAENPNKKQKGEAKVIADKMAIAERQRKEAETAPPVGNISGGDGSTSSGAGTSTAP